MDQGNLFGNAGSAVNLFKVVFCIIAVAAAAVNIYVISSAIKRSRAIRNAPLLTVPARVTGKRTAVSGGGDFAVSTAYYVTFEDENGIRTEFSVSSDQYALIAEGDLGSLTFKGPEFISFVR